MVMAGLAVVASSAGAYAAVSKTFSDGTHVIGKEVPAGTYRTRGGATCYWARLKSFSGSVSAIAANDNSSGPAVVTIARTDKGFQSNRCGTWTSNLKRMSKRLTKITPGTFIVKTDIAPGTYRSKGGSSCYWARLRSFGGGLSAIIANGNATGAAVVTIAAGDKGFKSQRCAIWTRI